MKIVDVQFHTSCVVGPMEALRQSSMRSVADLAVFRRTRHLSDRRQRSRSSPVRFDATKKDDLSDNGSPDGEISPPQCDTPTPEDIDSDNPTQLFSVTTMPYFSVRPPLRPLTLVPLASMSPPIYPTCLNYYSKPKSDILKVNSKEATHVVYSLLDLLILELPAVSSHSVGIATCTGVSEEKYRNMAVQVQSSSSLRSKSEGVVSDGEEMEKNNSEWLGGVRALRNSHVRLLLRQVQQLRHIEKLDRELKRVYARKTRLEKV